MTKEELKKKYAVLNDWIKKDIGGKAFLFVGNVNGVPSYCIARPYYGGTLQITDWMQLEQLEQFLWGVIHAREVRAAARGAGGCKVSLQGFGANVPGLVENGRLINE